MRHRLSGLPPTQLLSYLVGLGLGRALSLHSPDTEWAWEGDTLIIDTAIEDVPDFLVSTYQPTPVLSPWNNGSGFAPQDNNQRAVLEKLLTANERLPDWQVSVKVGRTLLESSLVTSASPAKRAKEMLVRLLRNQWPDRALAWLDAAVVLTPEGPSFPPLLGSGGNDGRLDFSTHFHSNLVTVLPETGASYAKSLAWARALGTGPHSGPLASRPVGQFDASGAGTPRSGAFGSGRTLVNPWAFVMMLEGSLLFAAAPARRLGETTTRASWPFTVSGSPDGPAPGSPTEEVRGELWVPVWTRPSNLHEIQQVFSEARATWDGSTAKQAAQMYGAVRSFGADRRIDRFIRFGLAQRNGLAFLAVPLDDVRVEAAPGIEIAIPIGRRMDRMRRAESHAINVARRSADRNLIEYLRHTRPEDLLLTLEALTLWELALARSTTAKEKVPHLPARPQAQEVLGICSDLVTDYAELRVAAALASGVTRTADSETGLPTREVVMGTGPERGAPGWRAPVVSGLGARPLVDVLCDAAVWCEQHGALADVGQEAPGRGARLVSGRSVAAPWQDTHAWARGELDEDYLQTAFLAFLALDWRNARSVLPDVPRPQIPLPELSILQGFNSADVRLPDAPEESPRIQGLAAGWLLRLRAGHTSAVLADATALLNRSDLRARPSNRAPSQHRTRTDSSRVDSYHDRDSVRPTFAVPIPSVGGPRLVAALMASISPPWRPRDSRIGPLDDLTTNRPPSLQEADHE